MTFAAPLFLLAALAAVIPVALHLIARRRARQLPFPSLQFLELSVERTRRRKRLRDAALMFLRAAALMLLAVGLARPAVTSLGALWGNAGAATVILLDNSASMGTIDRDRLRLATATAAAEQILDQLGERDQVALLPACGPEFADAAQLNSSQSAVRAALGQCQVSYGRSNLPQMIARAEALLAKSDAPNKQIFLLTDMQRTAWEDAGGQLFEVSDQRVKSRESRVESEAYLAEIPKSQNPKIPDHTPPAPRPPSLPPNLQIILVNCNRAPRPDAAVERIELAVATPIANAPLKLEAVVRNAAEVPQERFVELAIDGVVQARSPLLSLPPGGTARHEFTFTLAAGGLHRGEVRLVGEDGSRFNDARHFAVDLGEQVAAGIVAARRHEVPYLDDTFYLEQALAAAGGAINIHRFTFVELTDENLARQSLLFLVNLPAADAEIARRLADYVDRGGKLVWICGDRVDGEAYNQMNNQTGGRLLPAPLEGLRAADARQGRDAWHIGAIDGKSPLLAGLDQPPSLYQSVLVYKYIEIADEKENRMAQVLAWLDDGRPLLVERAEGRGRTLWLGVGLRSDWTNLPLRPIFPPLVARLALEWAGAAEQCREVYAGRPMVFQLPATVGEVELIPPGGETLRLPTEPDAEGRKFRYERTDRIGVYQLRLPSDARPGRLTAVVNFDPAEADPTPIELNELESLLGRRIIAASDPDDLMPTFTLLREGRGIGQWFLAAVLLALVLETFVANRLSRRQA
jgi:hypothetical protein